MFMSKIFIILIIAVTAFIPTSKIEAATTAKNKTSGTSAANSGKSTSLFSSDKSGGLFDTTATTKKTPTPAKTVTSNQAADGGTPPVADAKNTATTAADTASTTSAKNTNSANQDFSKEKLREIQEQAEKLYQPFKDGEIITVATRRKVYTGAFGGMMGGKLKVGMELVPTIDLSQDVMDKSNPDLMLKKQQDFIKENYYIPKRESEMRLTVSKKEQNKIQTE
jgi:hypothetical protein